MKTEIISPTPDQQAVIESDRQRLCVIACAGSGKTYTLTQRIAKIINENKTNPENVVAITFTEMAAQELQYRLAEVLGNVSKLAGMFIGTIHSFGFHLLKEFNPNVSEQTRVLSDNQQFVIFNRFWDSWNLSSCEPNVTHKSFLIDKIITSLGIIKIEDIPNNIIAKKHPALFQVFDQYEQFLRDNYFVDFDDLIAKAYNMLVDSKDILEKVKSQYLWYFIDEYQDVDPMQENLLSILCNKRNVCVVGDDDQSIYQFRGTDVRNLIKFSKYTADSEPLYLILNRRCRRNITRLSEKIISMNDVRKRIPKPINSKRPGGIIEIHDFDNIEQESHFIATKIREMQKTETISDLGQVAILLRSVTSSGRPYMDALEDAEIDYISKGDHSLFDRRPIPEIVNALEMFAKNNDDPNIDMCILGAIGESPSNEPGCNFISCSTSTLKQIGFTEIAIQKIISLGSIRSKYREGKYNHLCDLIYDVIASLNCVNGNHDGTVLYNLARFTNVVLEYADVEQVLDVRQFCAYIQAYAKRSFDQYTPERIRHEAVNILTIHQAKGLEFDVVFCPMLIKGRFPSEIQRKRWLLDNKLFDAKRYMGKIEDERRLFYVAITRAKEQLYLSYARNIGLKRERVPSIFINRAKKFKPQDKPIVSRSATKSPKQYLITSYSAMEYYLSCHFRYKLLMDFGFVAAPNPFFEYGRCIHTILSRLHSIAATNGQIDENTIKLVYEKYFYMNPRIPKGVILIKKNSGFEAIKNYCESKANWLTSTISTEMPFNYFLAGALIKGRIDLLISQNKKYHLIDFKTGKPHQYIRSDLQMKLYSLVCQEQLGYNIEIAGFYFVEHNKYISHKVTKSWLEEGKKEIKETISSIVARNYQPMPGQVCTRCEFRKMCPHKQRRARNA